MGGISGHRQYFIDTFIEIVGYKTGVLLDQSQLLEILAELGDYSVRLQPDGAKGARLHSVEVEEITAFLLHRMGNITSPSVMNSHIAMHHKYKKDDAQSACFLSVSKMFTAFIKSATDKAGQSPSRSGLCQIRPDGWGNGARDDFRHQ